MPTPIPDTATITWKSLFIALILAMLLVVLQRAVYPNSVYVSGDQNAQILAAKALVQDGDLLAPPRPHQASSLSITVPGDYRMRLAWFMPGYSVELSLLMLLGLSAAKAATAIYYGNLVLGTVLWYLALSRNGCNRWIAGFLCAFSVCQFMPCTTTDQLVSSLCGGLLLLYTYEARPWHRILVTLIVTFAVVLRYQAIALVPIIAAWELLASRKIRTLVFPIGLLCIPVLVFFLTKQWLSGGIDQWGIESGKLMMHLEKLPNALYLLLAGGWGPQGFLLRSLALGFVACAGLLLAWRSWSGGLKVWEKRVLSFQAIMFGFLLVVQYRYSVVYSANHPAFSTARFYTLMMPASLYVLIHSFREMTASRFRPLAALISLGVLGLCLLEPIHANRSAWKSFGLDAEGFKRKQEYVEIQKAVAETGPIAVLTNDIHGTALFAPKTTFPRNIRSLESKQAGVVVDLAEEAEPLVSCLGRATPFREKTVGSFRLRFYQISGNP